MRIKADLPERQPEEAVYGHPIVLAETFVDPPRVAGTAYLAAGPDGAFSPSHYMYMA